MTICDLISKYPVGFLLLVIVLCVTIIASTAIIVIGRLK